MKQHLSAVLTLATAFICVSGASEAGSILIHDAQVHSMTASGSFEHADILIRDGVIQAMGMELPIEEETVVIDAKGLPVTPAFFAGITISGLSEVEMVSSSNDAAARGLHTGLSHPEFDVTKAYTPFSSVIPITRVEGFGYALLGAQQGDRTVAGSSRLVRFDGGFDSFEGKDVLFIDIDGRSAGVDGGSRAAQWMLLEQLFGELAVADDDLTLMSVAGKRRLKAIQRNGVFVFSTHRAADIHRTLQFIAKHELNAVIHGGREAWILAEAIAAAEVPVILNSLDNLPADFDSLGARLDNATLLHSAGVQVLFTSYETHNARKVRQVAGNAVSYGLPYEVALRAMTATPAEIFGGRARSIEVGAIADLTLWSGDPLDVTSIATQVIIDGNLDSMVSRQTLLRDRYLPRVDDAQRAYIQ